MRKGDFNKYAQFLLIAIALLISASPGWTQPVVPGFEVEIYASVPYPGYIAFDPSGVLYVGNAKQTNDPLKIHRVGLGGSPVEEYGDQAFVDPDAVAFDASGAISGQPGSVIVGGSTGNPNADPWEGYIAAIYPDQTTHIIYLGTELANPTHFEFDKTGRLLCASGRSGLRVITSGIPTFLANSWSVVTVDAANRIYTQWYYPGSIDVISSDGHLLFGGWATIPTGANELVFSPYDSVWKGSLLALGDTAEGGKLYRIDPSGKTSEIGSGFGDYHMMSFGPDGALYVSSTFDNVIYRIVPSPKIQNPDNGHWYQRFDDSTTWYSAKAHCETLGGYLATLTSQDENDLVYDNLVNPVNSYWLGGTDEVVEGDWRWITGETWTYTNWAPWQPDDAHGGQDYLLFWSTYPNTWDDAGCPGTCSDEFYFICEWDPPNYCEADFNSDGDVDGSDLAVFAADFGRTDCP